MKKFRITLILDTEQTQQQITDRAKDMAECHFHESRLEELDVWEVEKIEIPMMKEIGCGYGHRWLHLKTGEDK